MGLPRCVLVLAMVGALAGCGDSGGGLGGGAGGSAGTGGSTGSGGSGGSTGTGGGTGSTGGGAGGGTVQGTCSGPLAPTGGGTGGGTPVCDPLPLDLDTPFATDLPPFASRAGQKAPTSLWASATPPLPTNASWQNLVVEAGGSRLDVLPYQLKAEPVWVDVANAAPVYSSTLASVPDLKQLMLGANEFNGATTHAVLSYDLFSVTLRYTQPTVGTMTLPLVQGSPYITADYVNLQPVILPGTLSISTLNGSTATGNVTGARFELALSDGTTWVVYASSSVTINWIPGKLYVTSKFTGTLRVAHGPTPAAVTVLDAHQGVIPRGGTLSASTACDQATLQFTYATTGTGTLLMVALPHHAARLVTPTPDPTLSYTTLRGPLRGVVGNAWTLRLPLAPIGFTAPRQVTPAHLDAVRAALAGDLGFVPDAATVSTDTYFGGKQLAKLARLSLIADEVACSAHAATLRARLAPLVAKWLDGTNGNPFVYDSTWGGVVSTQALADPGAQFGQGHYNDHHFHYGYLLYAAAVVARSDPAFAAAHRAGLLALVRDIANPSAADPRFPRFRHLDVFRGHSWAGGLTDHPDGQDQESTSEAANAWYALQLLGQATQDARMTNLGRVMLALEVDAAQTYWQIRAGSSVYPDPFAQVRCVGVLFETQAKFETWFGPNPEYVYGIQMLPFTPATEALLSPAWLTEAWPTLDLKTQTAAQPWRGFLLMAHASIAREAAWTEVSALTAWDDGNSQTNALWWVATRP